MKNSTKYIIGAATVLGLGALTVYAVKKYKKEVKVEGAPISAEEAREEVKSRKRPKSKIIRSVPGNPKIVKVPKEPVEPTVVEEVAEEESEEEEEDEGQEDEYDPVVEQSPGPQPSFFFYEEEIHPIEEPEEDIEKVLDDNFGEKEVYIFNQEKKVLEKVLDEDPLVVAPIEEVNPKLFPHFKGGDDDVTKANFIQSLRKKVLQDAIQEVIENKDIPLVDNSEESDVPIGASMTKEDKILRYAPDSVDARYQFRDMELAEWAPREDSYKTMLALYEFPFMPENDGDNSLYSKIVDYRRNFFGYNSRWTEEVMYADVILYFGKLAMFNEGYDIKHWIRTFLDYNNLHHTMSRESIDNVLKSLNEHVYYNDRHETYGLFGLCKESMNDVLRMANRHVDKHITYEIEFNEFLKSCC